MLWYTVKKTGLVRLVIVRNPDGIERDDFFVTSDLTNTGAQIATRYAGRWPIEVAFRDVKQHLGGQNPQSWKRQGPERAARLSLWLHAAIWCWYLDTHPTGHTWIPRPWYAAKKTPSFLDARAALRRVHWAKRINTTSTKTSGLSHFRLTCPALPARVLLTNRRLAAGVLHHSRTPAKS